MYEFFLSNLKVCMSVEIIIVGGYSTPAGVEYHHDNCILFTNI